MKERVDIGLIHDEIIKNIVVSLKESMMIVLVLSEYKWKNGRQKSCLKQIFSPEDVLLGSLNSLGLIFCLLLYKVMICFGGNFSHLFPRRFAISFT